MSGYGRGDPSGMEMAMMGMNFLSSGMRVGQAIGENRRKEDEEAGISEAYDYIAGKLGTTGDISMLDGDPILQTGRGLRAASKFSADRLTTEEGRNAALKKMSDSDDLVWRNNVLPNLQTAKEAYQNKDMTTFSSAITEASKNGGPHRLEADGAGGFNVLFRSDAAGDWTRTGRKMTAEEAMQQGEYYLGGEVKTLAGSKMEMLSFSPRFNAERARRIMATVNGNAQNQLDPAKQYILSKGGKQFTGYIQNDINYLNPPMLIVTDDKDNVVGQFPANQIQQAGFSSLGTKKDWMKTQESRRGRNAGGTGGNTGGTGGMPFKVSDGDMTWINGLAKIKDVDGNESVNPYVGMALHTLMSRDGLTRYGAWQAFTRGVNAVHEQLRKENPNISPDQAESIAQQYYCDKLMGNGSGTTQGSVRASSPVAGSTPPAAEKSLLQKSLQDAAAGNVVPGTTPSVQASPTAQSGQPVPVEPLVFQRDGKVLSLDPQTGQISELDPEAARAAAYQSQYAGRKDKGVEETLMRAGTHFFSEPERNPENRKGR